MTNIESPSINIEETRYGYGHIECRNCHDTEDSVQDPLIVPCLCAGSIKHVHRSCLNQWRAVSANSKSFTHCDVCQFQYRVKHNVVNPHAARFKFAMLVIRDFGIILLGIQALIWLLTLLIMIIDYDQARDKLFPSTWNHMSVNYVCGIGALLIILGVFGLIRGCIWCCCQGSGSGYTHSTYPYDYGYYWIWCGPYNGGMGSCDCSCGSCHGPQGCGDFGHGGGDGGGLLGLLVIVLIVIMVIGLVVGLIVLTIIFAKILQRHVDVLRMKRAASESEVIDLEEHPEALNYEPQESQRIETSVTEESDETKDTKSLVDNMV